MAQSYKVFINQSSITFTKKRPKNVKLFQEFTDTDCILNDEDIFNYLNKAPQTQHAYVKSKNPKFDMNVLFDDFKKIEAAGGIVESKGKFLVIKRNGVWDLPKGKLEKGEKFKIAAIREVEEECGIVGPVIQEKIGSTYHVYEQDGEPILKHTKWYWMKYDGPAKLKAQKEEGIEVAKWFTLAQLAAMRENTYASLSDVIDAFLIMEESE